MARDAGAKKVIMASCAPPIRYSNVYGIDMPSRQELVAHDRTEEQIAEYIGADMVIFQTLDNLIESCRKFNTDIETFDCSVFTGKYVTGGVDEAYLSHIQSLREDSAKSKQNSSRLTVPEHGANGWRSNTPKAGEADANGNAANGNENGDDEFLSCSGPMNGADAIGLYNEHSPAKRSGSQSRGNGHDSMVGLPNSFYAGIATMDVNDVGVSEGANAIAGGAGASAQPTGGR